MSVNPGFFKIFDCARPPLGIGKYVLQGDVSIPTTGGSFEQLNAAFDVVGPRYQLPPDQVLSTYPPSGSRGSYDRRFPQIVIKRRTLPWEWSDLSDETKTPTPWLALVLIAPGEGTIKTDQPVADCVTPGTELRSPEIRDTPKGTYLEVPESVVELTFPTEKELSLLVHVREVDLADTELAIGDDDGFLAVVIGNRIPQPGTTYTACLINVEGQTHRLPKNPPFEEDFDPKATVFDISAYEPYLATYATSGDAVEMGDTTVSTVSGLAAAPMTYMAANSGGAWAAGTAHDASGTVAVGAKGKTLHDKAFLGILDLPYAVLSQTFRFPVLTSWSFTCEGEGDFKTLAMRVTSRLLGYVMEGEEAPDGGPAVPAPPGAKPSRTVNEAPASRPLPLVTESGHVVTAYRSRVGEDAQAYFRGPLTPYPTVRPSPTGDDRVVIAHHSDQLRLVVPDGLQDLTYAAAFEIGRLLALSRPGVVALLSQWRRKRFAAATVATVQKGLLDRLSPDLRDRMTRVDPLAKIPPRIFEDLPGPLPEELVNPVTGRQFVRGILSVLGEQPIAPTIPDSPPGFARDDAAFLTRQRPERIAQGLGIDADLSADAGTVAAVLSATPVANATLDRAADLVAARALLEGVAGDLALGAEEIIARGGLFGGTR
jgi:hypothetical protein